MTQKLSLLALLSIFSFTLRAQVKLDFVLPANLTLHDVTTDYYGGIVCTGEFQDTLHPDPANPSTIITTKAGAGAAVLSYDSQGRYAWGFALGSIKPPTTIGATRGWGVAVDPNQDIYVTGEFTGDSVNFNPLHSTPSYFSSVRGFGNISTSDLFIAKYNGNGILIWMKHIGELGAEVGYDVMFDSVFVYVTGRFDVNQTDFDPGPGTLLLDKVGAGADMFVTKYDFSGNLDMAVAAGGSGNDYGLKLAADAMHHYYVAGITSSTEMDFPVTPQYDLTLYGNGLRDGFVAKYDTFDAVENVIGMGGEAADSILGIAADGEDIVLTGTFASDSVNFSQYGTSFYTLDKSSNSTAFVAGLDKYLGMKWAHSFGQGGSNAGTDVAANDSGQFLVTGHFSGSNVDFAPGAPVNALSSDGATDGFVASYQKNGQLNYVFKAGDFGHAITAVKKSTDFLVVGHQVSDSFDYDPGLRTNYLYGATGYLARYSECTAVHHSYSSTICSGDSLRFGGRYLLRAGVYSDTLQTLAGCDSIVELSLKVNPAAHESETVTICKGDSVLFGNSYLKIDGIYTDTFQTIRGCDSIVDLAVVVSKPDVNVTLNGSTLTATATNASFQWLDCSTGKPVNGATFNTYTPAVSGSYAVIVTNNRSCSDTSACFPVIINGISTEAVQQDWHIYPNPAADKVFIQSKNDLLSPVSVKISDMAGKVFVSELITEPEQTLDVKSLPAGIYCLTLKTKYFNFKYKILKL